MKNIDFLGKLKSLTEQTDLMTVTSEKRCKEFMDSYQAALQVRGDKMEEDLASYITLHESAAKSNRDVQETMKITETLKAELKKMKRAKEDTENQDALTQSKILKLKELLDQESREQDDLVKLNESKLRKTEAKIKLLKESMDLTLTCLGLEVRPLKDNRIQFVFRNISEVNCDLTVFVIIQLVDRVYKVLESEPNIAADQLKKIEDTLNETNNLSKFVYHMRSILRDEALKTT
ncbi:uncharacterized protein LOC143447369 [Clavelina lepadiformis]|uniref:uncharacterized protein LOC143447369 n=1 Tax=Clavelina lepadiformis TaxID=159417 RepID=UPI004041A7B6